MKVIAIVPTLNEDQGIAEVVQGFKKVGVKEIIVADGGSDDKTREIARKKGAYVLRVPRGKGNGFCSALQQIKIEDNAVYVMIDGDASYNPKEVGKLLKQMGRNDIVTGSRQILVHDFKSFIHVLGGQLISWLGSLLFWHWNPDICTGYWAFRGKALKKLKQKLTAKKFELEADLFTTACKLGLRHASVPVSYAKRKGESKLMFTDALKILLKIIEARFS